MNRSSTRSLRRSIPKKPVKVVKPSKLAETILKQIIKSFNVSYLDRLDGNDYKYVKDSLITRSDTFAHLIRNFEEENARPAKFLSGPQTFLIMKHPTKTIYLLGEQHTNENDCGKYQYQTGKNFYDFTTDRLIKLDYETAFEFAETGLGDLFEPARVADVIKDVMENGIAFTDLFVEEDPFNYFAIGEVYDNLDNLSEVAKLGFEAEIGRTHLTDIRGSSQLSKLSSYDQRFEFGIALEIMLNPSFNEETKKKYIPIFKKWHTYLFDPSLSNDEWKDRNINHIFNNNYLQKELSRSYLGEIIKDHYLPIISQDDYLSEREEHASLADVYDELSNVKLSGLTKQRLTSLRLSFTSFMAPIFDMYTLARIFKRFQGLDFDRPREPTNVIVYSGAHHVDMMANFLTLIGFDQTHGRNISKNCLYTTLKKPFFYHIL
jgi:hypothetical protein